MIQTLPPSGDPPPDAPTRGSADHPMRQVTRAVARDAAAWSPQMAHRVTETFDGLAAEWHTRLRPDRTAGLEDAFARGWPPTPAGAPPTHRGAQTSPFTGAGVGEVCLELGSGTGFTTPWLAERFPIVLAVDLSAQMLARAPAASGLRVRADGARLPLRDGAVDVAVLVNALLFPAELDRVLAPSGTLVWVNTSGASTPIHLPAEDVEAALPGAWDGVASQAGAATWTVLRRAGT